jgi:hypothetical protein
MSDPVDVDKQKENKQMNWFANALLVAGSPFFVLAFMDHHWAVVALKVYSCTAVIFGTILLFIERKSIKKRWLWIGMVPLLVLHTAVMYGLVIFNLAFPQIDRFPVATYGALVPLMALEGGILCYILNWFRPKKE